VDSHRRSDDFACDVTMFHVCSLQCSRHQSVTSSLRRRIAGVAPVTSVTPVLKSFPAPGSPNGTNHENQ
jgi:hypothetical protein